MVEPSQGVKEADDTIIAMAPLAVTFNENEIDDIDGGDIRRSLQPQRQRRNSPTIRLRGTTPQRPRTNSNSQNPESIPLVQNRNGGGGSNGPLANTEIIDVDIDERGTNLPDAHPGVDDGFFDTDGNRTNNKNDPPSPGAPFPASPFDPAPDPSLPDVNIYQHKKTLAQGLMDLALVSANANQLRYVLESSKRHPYYYFSLGLIITSLVIQVVVGVGLILNSRYNIKCDREMQHANRINNITMVLIFLLTFVNVFITAFGVAEYQPQVVAPTT